MSLKLSGKITRISDRIEKSEKFTMRLFLIETEGRFPQPIKFQLSNDRCDLIDNHSIGDIVTVHFDITGNEWKKDNGSTQIINNLSAWKIEGQKQQAQNVPPQDNFPNEDDGLPF